MFCKGMMDYVDRCLTQLKMFVTVQRNEKLLKIIVNLGMVWVDENIGPVFYLRKYGVFLVHSNMI